MIDKINEMIEYYEKIIYDLQIYGNKFLINEGTLEIANRKFLSDLEELKKLAERKHESNKN